MAPQYLKPASPEVLLKEMTNDDWAFSCWTGHLSSSHYLAGQSLSRGLLFFSFCYDCYNTLTKPTQGEGALFCSQLQYTTAGRSNKWELGAHYIYSREKGAVKANLELSAPSLLVQINIPVKKQCYPQLPHCPTLLNSIKISLNKGCPESHLSGDLRFCQAGDSH